QVLPHRVGGPLVPGRVAEGLLGGKNFDEAARKMIEFIRLRNVPMQRSRIELCEQIDAAQVRVDAVGDRNINEAIFPRQRDRWFGPLLCERKESGPLPSSHNDRKDIPYGRRHAFALHNTNFLSSIWYNSSIPPSLSTTQAEAA